MLNKNSSKKVLDIIMDLYPEPTPSLDYSNNFELLIAVMLSAQTTDVAVNKVTPKLFSRYETIESLANADLIEVQAILSSLGLYKNKSKYAIGIAKQIIDDHHGQVPNDRKSLEKLPGVGRKTASVVLNIGFNIPAFPVDTHISRVAKHHKLVSKKASTLEIEKRITTILPPEKWRHAHLALIYFGRDICHPRNPECHKIPELLD